jgi:hypothetical protein
LPKYGRFAPLVKAAKVILIKVNFAMLFFTYRPWKGCQNAAMRVAFFRGIKTGFSPSLSHRISLSLHPKQSSKFIKKPLSRIMNEGRFSG